MRSGKQTFAQSTGNCFTHLRNRQIFVIASGSWVGAGADAAAGWAVGAAWVAAGVGAAAGWAAGWAAGLADGVKPSTSALMMRPSGPEPFTCFRSMPFCSAMALANGDAFTRPSPLSLAGAWACFLRSRFSFRGLQPQLVPVRYHHQVIPWSWLLFRRSRQ